ncbi:three-Cys-motif partner protein TcmP [Umezakia ovalisporum]|jgi:three-Cys-motif partner protein|uniref:three-Cys-motif partner protein TcmP n=1 Tax=Umezakia ovalisporum TaxID=75695 RepID=UPI00247691AB|nr:three-Cys-motif partner protein TcmP [Umezakia ovalisporum]MBI1242328.1 three-Cys-motif partner protein TcmP [Nostoc sp. RI_552]MDH6089060.1 three-Cys-motif partner protein TcmP [Umezakia ovalisporum Ak1311]
MAGDSFFDEQTEQSLIKARIVEKYFWAWAKVIIPKAKNRGYEIIAYIDLFAGPGRYENGSKSTPIKVLETAIADPDMRNMLKTLFNDANSQHTNSLQSAINAIPGIQTLKYQPIVTNLEIGKNTIELFDVPTLFFLDPFGYKGLSLQLINSFVKNWGCDCLFFFNYNRISMGLGNPLVEEHINALFEKTRADELRNKLKNNSNDRENLIVTYICESLKEMDIKYVQNFRFKHEKNQRTSHHLIFVTKNLNAYNIIKDIMAKESSDQNQGVPSFEYNPATSKQPLLFELSRPLDELEQMLLDEFAGQTITMEEIYLQHHVGRAYIEKNYKAALKNLESQGKITAEPPANQRKKNKGEITFGDAVRVTFPPKR